MKKRIMILLLVLTTVFLAACGNGQNKEPEASTMPEAKETPAPEVFAVIGQEAEGENVFAVKLTNRTGADIVAVSVKDDSAETYPENMLPAEEVFVSGETRVLYYDAAEALAAAEANSAEAAADEPAVTPEYTVQLTFADGSVQELHAFPFGDAEACDIFLNGEFAYLSYTSLSTKETVITQEAEQAIRDAAAAEEAARIQAEENARQQTSWQQTQQPTQQTTQPPEENPEDGCVEDGLMY